MNIYHVKTEYLSILDELNSIDGLTPEIIKDTLAPYKIPIEEEILLVSANTKSLEILNDGIKKCISDMRERLNKAEQKIIRNKNYILDLLGVLKKKNIDFPEFSVSMRKNGPSVNIIDQSIIPDEYSNAKTTWSIDKASILKDLKNGLEVPGATLKNSKSLLIQ